MPEGIEVRHGKDCRSITGGRCNCDPSYRGSVWSPRDRKLIRKTFPTPAAAKAWRQDAAVAARKGAIRPPTSGTVRQEAHRWLDGAREGAVRDRSGRPYKPATLRGYDESLRLRLLPALGDFKLSDLRRTDMQALVDRLLGSGLSPSTVRNTLDPLRAIYRRAINRELVAVNPTSGLELPTARGKRDRISSPSEAAALLAALPDAERPLWATAFYAGLRRGELRALRWSDVDLGRSEISVERTWDEKAGPLDPKSEDGRRIVPLLAVLRDHLDEHKLRTARRDAELVFGRTAVLPFIASTVRSRALRAWNAVNVREASEAEREGRRPELVEPIGLHECRHTFASLLIAAGENPKAIQEFMGHATIQMTFDRYGHLMPGSRDEARRRLDGYLAAVEASYA